MCYLVACKSHHKKDWKYIGVPGITLMWEVNGIPSRSNYVRLHKDTWYMGVSIRMSNVIGESFSVAYNLWNAHLQQISTFLCQQDEA